MSFSRADELRLDEEIHRSISEYNALVGATVAAEFASTKKEARLTVGKLLELTDGLRAIDVEAVLSCPEAVFALRMVCCPPLTRDRLSGLSGVAVKRLCSLESGELPPRPSGRMKLRDVELPAIVSAAKEGIDYDLAPWLAEGRAPSDAEIERLLDIASDRAAVMSDSYNEPKRLLGMRLEDDVERWLSDNGYVERSLGSDGSLSVLQPGDFAKCQTAVELDGTSVWFDFVAAPKAGGAPVFFETRQSSNSVYAVRNRRDTDEAARSAISATGGRFALVLCGHFDLAYVRHQLESGKDVVWHHDLDALRDIGL